MIKYRIILSVAFLLAAFFPIVSDAANRPRLFFISFAWPVLLTEALRVSLPYLLYYALALAAIGMAVYVFVAPTKVGTWCMASYLFIGAASSFALAQVPLR